MANHGPYAGMTPAQVAAAYGISAAQAPQHSHSMMGTVSAAKLPPPQNESCICCQGAGYVAVYTSEDRYISGAMGAGYPNTRTVTCPTCAGKGSFGPNDLEYQPIKLYKKALEKAIEIKKENERKEAERKQRIKDSIMSKLTDEERDFLDANR